MTVTTEQTRPYVFGDFHTVHPPLMEPLDQLEKIAQEELDILLSGETGTGKELLARAVHQNSRRSRGNFIPINCASIPEQLLESELFGHEKGAFTGADAKKPGLFVLADSGTLFLDEIGELPESLQPKLLRALEEKAVWPVGGLESVPTDFRLICATNRDLEAMVAHREFREDLYYRIRGFVFKVPPLRMRKDDIVLFGNFFLEKYAAEYQKQVSGFSPIVWSRFGAHDWLGNVRELESVIKQAVALCDGDVVERHDLPVEYQGENDSRTSLEALMAPGIATLEREIILETLRKNEWHRERTAEVLGISPKTLYRKILEYGLTSSG